MESFNEYIKNLSTALGLNDIERTKLIELLTKFTDKDKYKLVENTGLLVQKLVDIDIQINQLITKDLFPYMESIKENLNEMNKNLAELQILSLIKRKENCGQVIKELINLLNIKYSIVNDIVKSNLEGVQSIDKSRKADLETIYNATLTEPSLPLKKQVQTPEYRPDWVNSLHKLKVPLGKSKITKSKYLKYKNKYLSLKKLIYNQ
jgi:DNA-binding MarR family transcriptional regulator